ncbi:MAG: hypothetical protein ACRCST_13660 [Turicibacter sp.]
MEAITKNDPDYLALNSRHGAYSTIFKSFYKEKFVKDQKVPIASKENLGNGCKYEKGRFLQKGKAVEILPNNTYIVRILMENL